ncbi:hypothetical protein C4K04_3151 [Pseudomonas chlororaphis]|uniref:Uncharacterized protein n=1 Tax=Pseudomonas chlororaphis TaxID=587753 RepID=A0A3G7TNY9_9PSED|nr:hypothetical protein C4K04_3151 [Pseudomonas chlororaphis]
MLEPVLFGQADKAVLEKFSRLNPQLSHDAKAALTFSAASISSASSREHW